MRPADVHAERENKLFVGMLPKNVDESLLETIFTPYGKIKEIHIIRTPEVSGALRMLGAPTGRLSFLTEPLLCLTKD